MIPHPDKAHRGGEDAYFASEEYNLNQQSVLVVADGVGGWSDIGIDPSGFSRTLCKNVRDEYTKNREDYLTNPKKLVVQAQQNNNHLGSATLVVVSIDPQKPVLQAAYVGDSGYAIFRMDPNGTIYLVNKFAEQQHGFNFPFQLARTDLNQGDDPESAITVELPVEKDDIIIVGSDGLFDNLHVSQLTFEIQRKVDRQTGKLAEKKQLALLLAEKAIAYGESQTYDSPFAQHAKESGLSYLGGKLDDTTVIIAQVEEDADHIVHSGEWTPQPQPTPKINPYAPSESEL